MAMIPAQEALHIACKIANGEQGIINMINLLEVARTVYLMEMDDNAIPKTFSHVLKEIIRYHENGRVSPGCECKPYKIGTYLKELKS